MTSLESSPAAPGRSAFQDDELDTFGGLLRRLAARWPDRPGLWHQGVDITFAAIDSEVDRWAKALLAQGVRRGQTVALIAGNCPRWMYAAFAVARIGAVCVPVNTWYKASEIEFLLRHTEATTLLTVDGLLKQDFTVYLDQVIPELRSSKAGRLSSSTPGHLTLVVSLDEDSTLEGALPLRTFLEEGSQVSDSELREEESATSGDDLLFLLYTSGSTSDPKGVQLQHRPALINDRNYGDSIGLTEQDRIAIFMPLFYSAVAVNNMPAAWTHGACIVLVDAFEAGAALHALEAGGATGYVGVSGQNRALLNHPNLSSFNLSRVEKGMTGFGADDKRLARVDLGFSKIATCYGLTESYGPVTGTRLDDSDEVTLNTVGKFLPGWEHRIVDPATGDPVPPGEQGELLIRGFITTGYFKNPAATAAAVDRDGWYHTGDLVHLDQDDRLHYHSRIKEVIKSSGQLIVPAEVEEALMRHPSVRQAFAFGVPDTEKGEVLAAFVEVADDSTEATLRADMRERIAGFKVPARIYVVTDEEIPRVASGKVPRHMLRARAAEIDAAHDA